VLVLALGLVTLVTGWSTLRDRLFRRAPDAAPPDQSTPQLSRPEPRA
jgi:hypothetical protein